jgi:hypothetical protein
MRKPKKPFKVPTAKGARFRPPETVTGHTVSAPVMRAIIPPIPDPTDEIAEPMVSGRWRGRRW